MAEEKKLKIIYGVKVYGIMALGLSLLATLIVFLSIWGLRELNVSMILHVLSRVEKEEEVTPGQVFNFQKNTRIDLGIRGDGCFYSLISPVSWGPDGGDYDYVLLRKNGRIPEVEYYIAPEGAAPNNYLVSLDLATEDVSDLMNPTILEEHPGLANREDYVFTMIDMDRDVIKSARDYSDEIGSGILRVFLALILDVLIKGALVVGILYAGVIYLVSFIMLILFILFSARNKKAEV